jgi:polysaccharide export outer membrane protein
MNNVEDSCMSGRVSSVLALLVIGSLTVGQAPAALGASGSESAYTLGPGDALEIVVVGDKDLSRTVTVKPDGSIDLPLIGEVTAAGRTTSQLAAELVKRYSKYLIAPSITVQVHEFRVDHVYVLGQVSKPGEYAIRPGTGILEALASAGGPTDRADLAQATIIREDTSGKADPIDVNILQAFAKNENPGVKLQAGDVVFVPAADRRMVILGQVAKPGAYGLLDGQHVSDLLAAAGGLTAQAAPQRAFLIRGSEQIPVDVRHLLAGDVTANLPLRPGDTLVVPESQDRIAVLGAVNKPGKYDLVEGMKLIDGIALAGGQADGANLSQVGIIRLEGGKTTTIAVDLNRALSGQDPRQNVPLRSGDIVYVPESGVTLTKAAQFFSILGVARLFFGGVVF